MVDKLEADEIVEIWRESITIKWLGFTLGSELELGVKGSWQKYMRAIFYIVVI